MSSAANVITQGNFPRLLQEGINAIATEEYKQYPQEWDKIFELFTSEKAYELDVAISETGLASLKPEGEAISYDGAKQDYTKTYTHNVYAIGVIITFEAMINNLYKDQMQRCGRMIARSLAHTDEQLAANVINTGYDTGFVGGDGQPLFSQSHPLGKGGSFANSFASFVGLSQASVEDALIEIEDYRDGAGLLADIKGKSLHIPRQLRYVADRILASRFEPDTANNAINPVEMVFEDGYHVNHRFTSATQWFIKTDAPDGFKKFERMGPTFEQDNDFGTSNYRHKGMFYNSYGWTDPRCAYGSGQ